MTLLTRFYLNNYLGLNLCKPNALSLIVWSLKSTNADAIDCFTSELIEKKELKWKLLKQSIMTEYKVKDSLKVIKEGIINDLNAIKDPDLYLDIRYLTQQQLDNLLITALNLPNEDDLIHLIKECIKCKKLLSEGAMIKCLQFLSVKGKTDLIYEYGDLLEERNKATQALYCNLRPFVALSVWKNGKHESALDHLIQSYNFSLNRKVQRILYEIFDIISLETLTTKSNAVLICLIKAGEKIYDSNKDIRLLLYTWKNCFQSDWFSDQQAAKEIFEKYKDLRDEIYERTASVCCDFLKCYNVDAVHRLIELFLKYNNKISCKTALNLLFEYQYWRKDLRACGEIIKNSVELGIPLSEAQGQKLIDLLLQRPSLLIKKPHIDKFEYKF